MNSNYDDLYRPKKNTNQDYNSTNSYSSGNYSNESYSSGNSYSQPTDSYSTFESGYGAPVNLTSMSLKETLTQEVVSKSFLFMFIALMISALGAYVMKPEVALMLLQGKSYFLVFILQLALVGGCRKALSSNSAVIGGILFAAYSFLTGAIFSFIILIYTASSIVSAFIITAAIFAIMAIVGLVTKIDLTKFGSLAMMALLGTIVAVFVNIFLLRSGVIDLVLSIVQILLFVGLTAYDAQKIKKSVAISNDNNVLSLALMGALQLYLDFIHIFLRILRIFGRRR